MNINIGDLINQSGFTHYTPSLQVRFAAPKGRVAVMLLLGDTDKKAPETFDATAALNNLGWIAETELTAAQSQLAALRDDNNSLSERFEQVSAVRDDLREDLANRTDRVAELAQQRNDLQQRLADAERRNAALTQQVDKAFESAARWVESRRDDYINDHGSLDPETGTVEFPGSGEEYVGELEEIAEGLRALNKPEEAKS